ncbi:uncharacterized protein LOC144178613 [Haemaphysalis longicornis]
MMGPARGTLSIQGDGIGDTADPEPPRSRCDQPWRASAATWPLRSRANRGSAASGVQLLARLVQRSPWQPAPPGAAVRSPSSRNSPSHSGGHPRPPAWPPAAILERPPADGSSPQPKSIGDQLASAKSRQPWF